MKKIFALITTILLTSLFIVPLSASNDDIYADKMDLTMQVSENGQIKVSTILDIDFASPHHGIYFNIPKEYQMTINGQKKKYNFPVTNISVEEHEFDIDDRREGVSIRMGNAYEEVVGRVRYAFSYTINTRDLGLDGYQMLYMNIVGNKMEYGIGSTTFTIEMPKGFGDEIYFYPPVGGSEVSYTRSGNVITGSYGELRPYQALTIEVPLTKGYFDFPNTDYRFLALGFGGVVAAVVAFVFMKFGRDPIITESVEFTAPDDLSSAEIGYVYRGVVMQKDVISLIIYWASQGYLIIEELEGDEIRLEKVKDLEASRPSEERRVFLALFKNRDEVTTKQLENKFAATVNHAMNGISKRFTSNPELRVFNRTSSLMKGLSIVLAPLIPAFYFATNAYNGSSDSTDLLLFFFIAFGIYVVITVGGSLMLAYDRIHSKSQRVGFSALFVMIAIVASFILSLIPPMEINFVCLAVMISFYLIAVFAAANTGKRTEQGALWLGKILGLKNFIEVAEHDRLVALAEDTPEIFYDILPYAYVLGITDIWSKKFESIAIQQPDWYVSSNPNFSTYLLWSSLNRSMTTVSSSMVSVPAPKGSIGGGGNFGGGGGGGFSGGGFGGGGSGGW